MRKYLYLFILMTISLFILLGCENETVDWEPSTYETYNNLDDVFMHVKEGSITPNGLTLVIENNSANDSMYGEFYMLEKKINGSWYQVPVAIDGDYGFTDIGYELKSGKNEEIKIDWEWLYGSLDAGQYRIVKDIHSFKGSINYGNFYLAAEFTIE